MNPIHPSSILFILKTVNRFFSLKTVFVFLIFASFAFLNKANAVEVVIEGASSFVCPKGTYTYTARTYEETFGNEVSTCSLNWQVFRGNEIVGSGAGANFTFTYPDEGPYEIKVVANYCAPFGGG